ncbi:NADP-dependent alcohol dehydrogenase 6 [Xylona heveae TC161]|uniref:alcohol dehydrogenase (NADP(+)) n=1 Tax=Xylona heveae (strain CBS 132557 / TC161) TaxID=1328760 RepID=A0A164ZUF5_XYLHT|nr:NADP-dependent alcohol dehydrogenase 6 [Xylona heveae TC161]KZF19537.1 NADP-dependent alcohol dehydrogenase 6 [Xylona heveae TC161]
MVYPNKFEGFMIESQDKWSDFSKKEFDPKPFEDYDIDIQVEACGVCGSDVHTITGGWGPCNLPLCVGHEIVGKAIKVGDKVSTVKVGDRVGVGAQIWACLKCKNCKADNENYCPHQVDTYNAPYPDGTLSQGGYSSHVRAHEYFTFPIPENIASEVAAPMLCAGITTYSPLVRAKIGAGKKVAVVGIGGLGHFGVMWANALGAETYAISHTPNKEADAKKMGAKEFICSKDKDWAKPWAFTFDLILNCSDMTSEFNLPEYMSTLAVNGTFHHCGMPDKPLPQLKVPDFVPGGYAMSANHIGSRPEILSMLKLASDKGIKTWVEKIDISEKGCKEAVERVYKNDVHYRFSLVGFDKAFSRQ